MTDSIKIKEIRDLTKTCNHPYWRIDWFGQILKNPAIETEYLIEVGLSAIQKPLSNRQTTVDSSLPGATTVMIGVGQLPAIQLGSIFDNGSLVGCTSGEQIELSIDTNEIGANQIIQAKSKLDERRYLIPPWEVNLAAYHAFDSYCLRFNGKDRRNRTIDIILPCMVLIRAYYAISTRLTKAVFDGTICANLNNLINVEKSYMSETTCIVTRRKNVSDFDCYLLGRLIADMNTKEAVCLVYHSMAEAKYERRLLHPKSCFPFKGKTTLTVEGTYIDKADDNRFLVRNIRDCGRQAPYKKLIVIADNDGRTAPPETDIPDENKSEAWKKPQINDVPDDGTLQSSVEADSSFGINPIVGTENLFTGFADIAIEKLPKERCEYKNAGVAIDGRDYPNTSLGTGYGKGSLTRVKPTSINPSTMLQEPRGYELFENMIKLVGRENNMRANLMPGNSRPGCYEAVNTNIKASRNWSFINNKTKTPRRIMIGKIEYKNRTYLVLDIEPRHYATTGFKVEVITSGDGSAISKDNLKCLLRSLSMHRGVMNNITEYPSNVVRVGNGLKHTWGTAEKFAAKVTSLIIDHS